MFEEQDKKTAQEWEPTSERADAIHYILAVTNCPKKVSQLINILLGISKGFPEFDSTHRKIATRLSDSLLTADENAIQWVKRAHRELKEWQDKNQLNLVEYEPGSKKKDGTLEESRYRLQIIHFADMVIELAKKSPLWKRFKSRALKEAALELKPEYCPMDVLYHRRRKTPDRSSMIRKHLTSSVSHMKKALEMLDKKNDIILIDEETIEEYEKVLNELKSRRLSEEFFLQEDKKKSNKSNNPPPEGGQI